MTIRVTRDRSGSMKHVVAVRDHRLTVDEPSAQGGEDAGPTPHDLYDAALGACKALTVLWYARRRQIPVEDITVSVERDARDERAGTYRLRATVALTGALSEAQRQELLTVAGKCPVHKLMTQATTEVVTELAPPGDTAP
jgi:putative redox protein